ncbi:MAG: DUF4249 domain-containing protein [Bacteroidota bacterium]
MIRRILPYLVLAWLGTGATCERTLELDIEQPPPRLVVNSSFTLGEKVRVAVSESQSIESNTRPVYLANAEVSLLQGEDILEVLALVIDSAERIEPYYTTVLFEPEAATAYTVKVEAIGYETVEAHSFIPEPVAFSRLEASQPLEIPASRDFNRRYAYDVSLDFDDPVDQENFYHLNLFQEIHSYALSLNGDTMVIDSRLMRADIQLEENQAIKDAVIGGLLLRDNPSNMGYDFPIEVEITPEFEFLGKVFAELRTVSKEYYLYYSTYSRQQRQTDGPFNDPVVLFNNVENGHGYFAGYNTTQDSVSVNF